MAVSTALAMRMAVFTLMTGVIAAVIMPFVVSTTAQIAVDHEIELPTLIVALEPLRRWPLLGSIPGLFAVTCGVAALANRKARMPLAMLGNLGNLVAVLLLVAMVLATMAPLYSYQEL